MSLRSLVCIPLVSLLALAACSNQADRDPGTLNPGNGSDGSINGGDASFDPDGSAVPDDAGSFQVDIQSKPEINADAFWADDPPPKSCGDGGVNPVVPGGTPECPDDKNREGCSCGIAGAKVACWPGYRRNRNRGICHDGQTTCVRKGETQLEWGPCTDYQLPTGTTGKEACTCFSAGRWDIDNLSPCFYSNASGAITGAVSTVPTYDATGKFVSSACPPTFAKPAGAWSKTRLTVDCAGRFTLCFTIKAGDAKAPLATDCVVTKQCTTGDYLEINKPQPFGDLASWINSDATCAAKFNATGGYGEMSVDGLSIECDEVKKIFNVVPYCSAKCSDPANKTLPECVACSTSGGGGF